MTYFVLISAFVLLFIFCPVKINFFLLQKYFISNIKYKVYFFGILIYKKEIKINLEKKISLFINKNNKEKNNERNYFYGDSSPLYIKKFQLIRRRLRIKNEFFRVKMKVGFEDPALTAFLYGLFHAFFNKILKHSEEIIPIFDEKKFILQIKSIFRLQIGNIILTALIILFHKWKGDKSFGQTGY